MLCQLGKEEDCLYLIKVTLPYFFFYLREIEGECCIRTVAREDKTQGFFVACFERLENEVIDEEENTQETSPTEMETSITEENDESEEEDENNEEISEEKVTNTNNKRPRNNDNNKINNNNNKNDGEGRKKKKRKKKKAKKPIL